MTRTAPRSRDSGQGLPEFKDAVRKTSPVKSCDEGDITATSNDDGGSDDELKQALRDVGENVP